MLAHNTCIIQALTHMYIVQIQRTSPTQSSPQPHASTSYHTNAYQFLSFNARGISF
ncbi:hypothetical protein GQ44DRAFT_701992 [Phaeosphaeriaceae sp. PMI808]|nr:hypothetical protein GQ44DRAFT_701992 [Phaeosphaeriaceae sp. PMI808]